MKRLIVITGATACGKTSTSVQLAQLLQTEIVSCDSRQFYKEMSIGTAKPTSDEMKGIKHHFINSHPISEEINAGQYEKLALNVIEQLHEKHDDVILTGGSGLFIDAVVNGLDDLPPVLPEVRESLNLSFKENGLTVLIKQLKELDPKYHDIVDLQNPVRIIRALEVCISTGKPYSEQRKGEKKQRPFRVCKIVLDWPREILYDRINLRVDQMIQKKLEEEVRFLLPFKGLNALNTVGYQEIFKYFDQEINLDEAINLIKRNSRRYAKRQLTWFRRDPEYHWVPGDSFDAVLKIIE